MRTKRFIRSAALFLLAGILINFVVAQAAGWLSHPSANQSKAWNEFSVNDMYASVGFRHSMGKDLYTWVVRDSVPQHAARVEHAVPRWVRVWDPASRELLKRVYYDERHGGHFRCFALDVGVGWPVPSFGAHAIHSQLSGPDLGSRIEYGWDLTVENRFFEQAGKRVLAWKPLWPGVAWGSLFWAALMAAMQFTSRAIRGVIRLRRGQCGNCGYQVRDMLVCPECGKQSEPFRYCFVRFCGRMCG